MIGHAEIKPAPCPPGHTGENTHAAATTVGLDAIRFDSFKLMAERFGAVYEEWKNDAGEIVHKCWVVEKEFAGCFALWLRRGGVPVKLDPTLERNDPGARDTVTLLDLIGLSRPIFEGRTFRCSEHLLDAAALPERALVRFDRMLLNEALAAAEGVLLAADTRHEGLRREVDLIAEKLRRVIPLPMPTSAPPERLRGRPTTPLLNGEKT